ncbi:hypothetical protein KKF91_22440, partial [Myxococcota bacterium]|nr:hypothetical protein [Myxococcota bacterium]
MRARRVDLERFNKDTTTHAGLWLDKFLSEQNQQGGGDEGVGEKAAHFRSLGHHPCPVGYREAFERWKSGLDGQ